MYARDAMSQGPARHREAQARLRQVGTGWAGIQPRSSRHCIPPPIARFKEHNIVNSVNIGSPISPRTFFHNYAIRIKFEDVDRNHFYRHDAHPTPIEREHTIISLDLGKLTPSISKVKNLIL